MPLITAPIQPADIRYQGLGGNKCVFGIYNKMAGIAEMVESNCELHLRLSRALPE